METNRVPVTYKNEKAAKELPDYKKLWQVAFWGFDTRIGTITNASTAMYEVQSRFDKTSPEYIELDQRLKLFRHAQGVEIDRAKNGSKPRKLPKKWKEYQKINDDDTPEEKARKEFENKLVIDKRPYFMKYLYPKYAKEYKNFQADFERYSIIKFGKAIEELTEEDEKKEEYKEMMKYYKKKNPLLETNGVMNRLCRHMESELKDLKAIVKSGDNDKMFEHLFNPNIPLDQEKIELMAQKKKEYKDFKVSKQLASSEFSNYEQYYKHLRNDCLENISSNIQELANLAVYLCYKMYPKAPKDFCWDVFGNGIVENLKEKNPIANVPHLSPNGSIDYLGNKYEIEQVDVSKDIELIEQGENMFDGIDDLFEDIDLVGPER